MMKDKVLAVKDAVHKLQLSLLDGIKNENQLLAAGSLLSRNDYQDVVTERTLANVCGYPLCSNSLPSERPRKGRYRISLKEHTVYDLQESYMYCSSSCLINSRAFATSLLEERSSTLNPAKIDKVLKLFEGLNLDSNVDMGKNEDLGLSGLMIQEKADIEAGDVSLEGWIGPSNAIDGYVPRRDRTLEARQLNNDKKGRTQGKVESKQMRAQPNVPDIPYDMNFTSTVIFEDEYTISKTVPPVKGKESKGKISSKDVKKLQNDTATDDKVSAFEDTVKSRQNGNTNSGKESAAGATVSKSSLKTSDSKKAVATVLKSSLKTSDSTKATCSVTWADKKNDVDGKNLHECRESKDDKVALLPHSEVEGGSEESDRFASAEACARALSQASEAVASGKFDASDAVSEAGVIILPPPHGVDESKSEVDDDFMDTDPLQLKWPPKPGFSSSDLFDSEDSWYDSPPEGFNLTLSPFSTMFMALFSWISSSSLAYIYGKEDSFHEEYLSVNGREYPRKIFAPDGRSSEIKQTLDGCLSRVLPGLVAELRLPIPLSVLEKGLGDILFLYGDELYVQGGRLLETMSFINPLPAFRMKQWQVILLLFLDALSVSRIPALTPCMLDRRILFPKVLEGAQISSEEFEIMKDLIIPLGRVPQFSTQSGG